MRSSAPPQIKDLTLEVTQKCFQNCIYCSSGSSLQNTTELKFETVKKILDDFQGLGGKTVELSGGEPLCYKDIYNTIEYAKNIGLSVDLFTSAYIDKVNIDFNYLDKIDRIYINLQAPNAYIHNYLTDTSGSFKEVIRFIKECKNQKYWVGTHIIPLSINIDEIDDYIKLARRLEVNDVSLLRFVEQGRGINITKRLNLNNDEILQLYSLIEEYSDLPFLKFKIGCPLDFRFVYKKKREAIPCSSGITRCVVRPNGNVIPCPAYKDSMEFFAGNIHKESIKTIWKKSPIFWRLREFDHKKITGLCKTCPFLDVCKGRCHAQRFHKYGDIFRGPDPYCPIGIYAKKSENI